MRFVILLLTTLSILACTQRAGASADDETRRLQREMEEVRSVEDDAGNYPEHDEPVVGQYVSFEDVKALYEKGAPTEEVCALIHTNTIDFSAVRLQPFYLFIHDLRKNVMARKRRSLCVLMELNRLTKGEYAAPVVEAIYDAFYYRTSFFIFTASHYDERIEDLAYHAVINHSYVGLILDKLRPVEMYIKLIEMGEPSDRFRQMYDYYIRHPEDLRDRTRIPLR